MGSNPKLGLCFILLLPHLGQKTGCGFRCLTFPRVSFKPSIGMLLDLDVLLGEAKLYEQVLDDIAMVPH